MKTFLLKLYYFIKNKLIIWDYSSKIREAVPKKVVNSNEYLHHWERRSKSDELFTVEFKEGFKLLCNPADLSAVSETCILKDYEPTNKFNILPGQIILDVGANIGSYSIYAASKGARVFSFEPDSRNIERFEKNVEINKFEDRITLIPKALHTQSGTVKFHLSSQSAGGHSVLGLSENVAGVKDVPSISLSDFLKEQKITKVDIMKIDIEGAEYDILSHTSKEVYSQIMSIVGEYHVGLYSTHSLKEIKKSLSPYYTKFVSYSPYYFYANN